MTFACSWYAKFVSTDSLDNLFNTHCQIEKLERRSFVNITHVYDPNTYSTFSDDDRENSKSPFEIETKMTRLEVIRPYFVQFYSATQQTLFYFSAWLIQLVNLKHLFVISILNLHIYEHCKSSYDLSLHFTYCAPFWNYLLSAKI